MQSVEETFDQWAQTISAGNDYFNQFQHDAALQCYRRAINIAESIMLELTCPKKVIASLLISYQNIADLHTRNGDWQLAYQELNHIYNALLDQLTDTDPETDQAQAILWGISKCYLALMEVHKSMQATVSSTALKPPSFKASQFEKYYH